MLTRQIQLSCSVALLVVQSGCYRHVVRTEGVAGDHEVHEPNLKENQSPMIEATENFLFGEDDRKKR